MDRMGERTEALGYRLSQAQHGGAATHLLTTILCGGGYYHFFLSPCRYSPSISCLTNRYHHLRIDRERDIEFRTHRWANIRGSNPRTVCPGSGKKRAQPRTQGLKDRPSPCRAAFADINIHKSRSVYYWA